MRNKSNLMKSQSGQILAYTIIIIMLAGLIIAPLLSFTYGSWRAVNIRQERTQELYASDTGIEDALYQIKTEKEGTGVGNLGFGETYDAGTPNVNDRDVNVTVEKIWLPQDLPGTSETEAPTAGTDKSNKLVTVGMLSTVRAPAASDDFSSGGLAGGEGWPTGSSWATTGDVTIGSGSEGCDSGYCLKLTDVPSTATRTADLLRYMQPQLKFTARALSLEAGDTIDLNVTFGNSTPETVWSWADGSETTDCTAYDFDLYNLYGWETDATSVPLQIEFDAKLSIQDVAEDDFSSGNWAGGSGWWPSSSWTASGSGASVVNTGSPHSDSYHVKLSSSGYVYRRVNLSSVANPQITVWAKTNGFGASDRVYLKVSTRTSPSPTTPSDWSAALLTWSSSSSSSYTAYGYDLSAYAGQNVWILFSGSMSSSGATVASDGFESGGWDGNPSQWTAAWDHSSSNSYVQTSGSPRSGSYHLALRQTGYAEREKDLSSYTQRQLRFYYKMSNNWESSDHGYLKIYLNGSLYDTVTLTTKTGYSNNPSPYTYDLPQGQIKIRFEAATSSSDEYLYVDDISILGDPSCFYFDDVSITEGDSFYADNIWIGSEYNSNTIEIAYIDPTFGDAYLDRIGVWMPAGCHYVEVVGNETTVDLNQEPTTILTDTYAGGTILEWDYGDVALHLPSGQVPIVKTLTFVYKVDVTQDVEGMFVWIAADAVDNGPPSLSDTQDDYLSWDKGYEIYKAVSQAYSDIYGSNTQVTAYVAQGEVNKQNAVAYGDYVATGSPLLIETDEDSLLAVDYLVDPAIPATWVTEDGFYYDGRSEITAVPSDAKVVSAWLYWSAFVEDYDRTHRVTDWEDIGSYPDTVADFMYPYWHGAESFSVSNNSTSESYTVSSYSSAQEPMDLLTHEPVLTLSPIRYWSEDLGTAVLGDTPADTFLTDYRPISSSPAPKVWVNGFLQTEGSDYVIDYPTGNVTIIDPALSGAVVIDYSVDGLLTLVKDTDYTINQVAEGTGYKYTGFTVINDKLVGTVTIDYYYSKHWHQDLAHAAVDRYGTALDPVYELSKSGGTDVGWYYACFNDVTDLLTAAAGSGGEHPGNGQYAVNDVTGTPGDASFWTYRDWCYSGWSLIIVYQSPSETAHQFYLYDPIHNNDHDGTLEEGECPFQKIQYTADTVFTLTDFYPPEGMVEGRTTYFVGEGDDDLNGDSVGFKGISQSTYTTLSGTNNPADDVMNTISTTGERGVDIDTFEITSEVGADTEANIRLHTNVDGWQLVYMILSFKTNQVPKSDFAFNVASVTYQYELNQ